MELLALLAVAVGYFVLRKMTRKRPRGRIPRRARTYRAFSGQHSGTICDKVYVTDGDGLRVRGYTIRISGLDAAEHDQAAKHRDGYWFNHGKRVKSALIREIGGKQVRVAVEGSDKFGRLLGTVTCNGRDVGEWLVREGHAIAAYSDRYWHVEREARQAKRGMWDHAHNFDPRDHRHRKRRKG